MDKIINQVLKENTIGIWKLDGNQLYGNDCFLDLIGVPKEMDAQACLKFHLSHVHPEDQAVLKSFVRGFKEGKATSLRKEVRVSRENGKYTWTSINVMVRDYRPEEGIIEMLCINYDITTLKETEQKLIIARDKAEELDRLKSAFLANMSHEIRTPLNAIVGFSSLLIDTVEATDEQKEYADIIQTNSELLLQLISDVLDVSRLESGKLLFKYEWCELVNHCQNMITLTRKNRTRDIDVRLQMPKEPYMLYTDPLRLQQVIINLLNNALKFTPDGGSITLDYEIDEEDQCMLFSVTDTGSGIPEDKQELVFQRFEKLNEFVQGTGLGLAICKLTIQRMGGDIWIDKNYKNGARFVFSHPIKKRESEEK